MRWLSMPEISFCHYGNPNMASYRYRAMIPARALGAAINDPSADVIIFAKPIDQDVQHISQRGLDQAHQLVPPSWKYTVARVKLSMASLSKVKRKDACLATKLMVMKASLPLRGSFFSPVRRAVSWMA